MHGYSIFTLQRFSLQLQRTFYSSAGMFTYLQGPLVGKTKSAGTKLQNAIRLLFRTSNSAYSSLAAQADERVGQASASQLIRLNELGILPSVAKHWDASTADAELRNAAASSSRAPNGRPTAVQLAMAQRAGVTLGPEATRKTAALGLAAVQPPSVHSLAVLYGVLEYDGAVPSCEEAARQLIKAIAQTRPHQHPLDLDLSPVALSQMSELFNRLGYIGRPPFSYGSAQLLALCARSILVDVEEESRLRQLPGLHPHQAALIRLLRRRRAPPGTRGMPAVGELDLDAAPASAAAAAAAAAPEPGSYAGTSATAAPTGGVSRLAAARNLLQLLQNHELSATPRGPAVEALRALGHWSAVPPTTGEALMLAGELRNRCMKPTHAQLAALRTAGYGGSRTCDRSSNSSSNSSSMGDVVEAPVPESVAHVKAILRVLRRADKDAATPASRGELREWEELRRRAPAGGHAAAAAVARVHGGGGGGGGSGRVGTLGPCPSRLEVRTAIEELPLSEEMLERLLDLGWSGPLPPNHGSAMALETYLIHHRTTSTAAPPNSTNQGAPAATAASSAAPAAAARAAGGTAMCRVDDSSPHGHYRRTGQQQQRSLREQRHQAFVARLGRSEEEALLKIQIRGLFPGAVSEWYLPSMCKEEAELLLGCLVAARRAVLQRVSYDDVSYDGFVERWGQAEVQGEWWGMECLWH
ncbi:hypothetical protein Agub_g6340 [Astrephomene gubernaculifera]|uniref:Uncharacterized protein n=1 Tax=Astrephomene gubernaculifera TaxID=47775 RepID=A0AAD3DNA8_9CHLO|nr:hypothetical protein Agub_g6340 [Astrephomene gubernaculifera]